MPPPHTHGIGLNGSAETVLIRLDERMKTMVAVVERLERKVEEDFVTRAEFTPVQKVVYGAVALALVGVVTALLALVVQTGGAP